MRFQQRTASKPRRYFAVLPIRALSREHIHSAMVWLEWVEIGYEDKTKIYYLIDKKK